MIEARGVWARRGGAEILKDVFLKVSKGETLAIIGPTGSGKTTLIRILDLLDPPDKGLVFFEGVDVTEDDKAKFEARRRMAMVFQKPSMFNVSVEKNVSYGLKIRGVSSSTIQDRVRAALRDVGLIGYENRRAFSLSGGEAQRVALARALVTEPELLLLDEATANLDPRTAETIEDMIRKAGEGGLTVVMATHDLDQARRLANRIGVVIGGELVQLGAPEEVFESPRSEEVARFIRARSCW
ncbi:MAG TPA: phosphate ABC transporter ATP-binding protein [Methanotrichaceae archaeon]|nr:phosphate ABC transporter ATP-binding protein [Methanotrichaceae archaeon]